MNTDPAVTAALQRDLASAREAEATAKAGVLDAARRGETGNAASLASARATDAREAAEAAVIRAAMVVEATGPIYSAVDAETIVDALLAAGWTRKQEEW